MTREIEAQAAFDEVMQPAVADSKTSLFDNDGRKKSQATVLVDLCADIELFHDADSACYAIIQKPKHREVWPVQSRSFRNWLSHQYFDLTGKGARGASVADALATVEARAQHKSEQRKVFQRVAWLGDKIMLDLADDAWRVVEIDAAGWRILDQSPVMFTRRSGMAPLPSPVPGTLADIVHFINVASDDMPLIIGWLLMAARGCGPYPVLILNGERMLTARRNLYPFQYATECAYFRLQVIRARAGTYWHNDALRAGI